MTQNADTSETLNTWLLQQGLEGTPQEALIEGFCARLVAMGIPLMRLHTAQSAFHPRYGSLSVEWHRSTGVTFERFQYSDTPVRDWQQSPFYYLLERGELELRERLARSNTPSRFPLLNELREAGATDYFVSGLMLEKPDPSKPIDPDAAPEGLLVSWVSDADRGFSDADLGCIRAALPFLGLALKSAANRQMASELMRVYLGRDAGHRVMSGELQRGSLQQIEAVIWYFDLIGFTKMAEQLPGPDLIAMLNEYFGIAVAAVQSHGGHVLKFMGDGMLAMFDRLDPAHEADAALDAAAALRREIEDHNHGREAEGMPITGFTLALHAGEILYGNIGAENRLDFTVIGPAVNLTARLSGMHRALGQNIILSQDVVRAARSDRHDIVSLGRYMLRSVAEPQELFTLFEPGTDQG